MASRFLGCFLSESKPHVFFEPPAAPLSRAAFRDLVEKHGARVDQRAQLLYDRTHLYVNGGAVPWPAKGAGTLRDLADRRVLAARGARAMLPEAAAILYNWYRDGYAHSGVA
jgi:50S ribosomal protein L16 3-hydroxylase